MDASEQIGLKNQINNETTSLPCEKESSLLCCQDHCTETSHSTNCQLYTKSNTTPDGLDLKVCFQKPMWLIAWLDKARPLIGTLLLLTSALLFCLCSVIVKSLKHVDPFSLASFRFLALFLLALPVVIWRRKIEHPFPKARRMQLCLRSVLGASHLIIHYYALKHVTLADTTMLSSGSPLFTAIFARIFLKEAIDLVDILSVFIVFAGIVLIVKPPFIFGQSELYMNDPEAMQAVIILIFSTIFFLANVYVMLRKLKDLHWSVVLTTFGFIGFLESVIVAVSVGNVALPVSKSDIILCLLLGFMGYLGQILFTISAYFETASKVAVLRKAFDIIFAFLFQITFFKEIPGIYSICGAGLITLAIALSGLKKLVDLAPEDHVAKTKYLSCLYKDKNQV